VAGLLYTFGALILPAMAARLFSRELGTMAWLTPVLAVGCAIIGTCCADVWDLPPAQVVVATITSDSDAYALEVRDMLKKAGLRAEADLRNEKINYKVREHSVQKVPVILVVGKREMEERAVNVRRLGSQNQTPMGLDAVLAALKDEAAPPDLKRD
jgi:histidyl-tRNA synthetase